MTIPRSAILLPVVVFAAVAAACSGGSSPTPQPVIVFTSPVADPTATPTAQVTTVDGTVTAFEVHLSANGSSQVGTAVFTRTGASARVAIRIRPGERLQSASLMRGDCSAPEGFVESLGDVIGGVLNRNVSRILFDELLEGDVTLVINPNRSSFRTIASCADMPKLR